ncbi:hypothetical protein FSP39_010608 [Pinctada imbricata]|uniref:Uncharacterized protein n=1 Tax=Pinctada imbricata TaxID=66713 RepID=A0AA88XN78_PINIB|nr:hypothetical protein FSP39_010608 [Pinctada imbricata]
MYRRYLEQLKLMEADKEQAVKDADTEEKDDPPKKAKPTKKKKPEGDPVTPYKSKPGTLVPPTLTPPSAAILGDYSTADVLASQTFRLYVGGLSKDSENLMIILESSAFALFNIDERSYSRSVEFATDIDGIAISKDETIIVLCNTLKYEEKGETFCVYDVKTLERIKEFKATVPFYKTLTISHDSKFVFYASYPNQIASLNLETGQTGILHTDSDIITDFRHLADDTWVSVSENRLKIWKEDKTAYSVPYEWNKDNLPPISDIYPMENPRYVVFIRKNEEDEDDQGVNGMQNHISEKNNEELIEGKCYAFVIQVYDISSKKVVRQLAQDDDDFEDLDLQGYALLDDCSLALVVRSGKMVKICLNTMKVTLVYATPRKEVVTIVYDSKRDEMDQTTVILSKASAGRELVTRAESKGSVLVYDNVSGKRVAKLRPPADVTSYRIEYLKVNESGEVCITLAERRSTVLVFNVPKRQYLFKILLEDYMYNYQLMFMPMTENLIAVLRKKYSKKMQRGEDITATSVFKLKESPGELAKLYVDKDYKIKYLKKIPKWSPLPRSKEIVGHTFVDEDYYITMSRDGFMRVWDMNKDEIERIQVGEIEDLECEFESNIQYAGHGPFIVAYYGNTFKVLHKGSWKLLAIFTLDESICMMDWTILKDGKSILLVTCNDEIHHITLKNGGIDVDLAKEPELFIGEDSDNHLNIEDVEWAEDGPHESDSDSDDYKLLL